LVSGGYKLLGSAQRRSRKALLQHGSLLLRASPLAPELPGMSELGRAACPDARELAEAWHTLLAAALDVRFFSSGLTAEEEDRARYWEGAKFADPRWTARR
jgi:lipoate-protein ligase A